MLTLAKKVILFCVLLLFAQAVISLDWKIDRDLESGRPKGIRVRIPEIYTPSQEILAIQKYQQTHPTLGFLWKSNIDTSDGVLVAWGDVAASALCTDEFGFANTPTAIMQRRNGIPVDIIGVGASYLGGAHALFHDYFALSGYFYYNLAHGRFTLPQFNIALREIGIPMKPKWVVYELNEASFTLIVDFEDWQQSGMDWFTYHGGTWCGPAVMRGFPHDQLRGFPRLYCIYRAVMRALFRNGLPPSMASRRELIKKSYGYIVDAYRTAQAHKIGFVVLLIPSKNRMICGPSPSLYVFEEILPRLRKGGIPFIDLRTCYAQAEDAAQLYFQFDAHWNNVGIYMAAREILAFIENRSSKSPNG